jgi:CRISPR-associated endonuclease/helicase Cas3
MTTVELQFPFTGTTLPSDHGYALYGALARIVPELHEASWAAIETVPGIASGDGVTYLDPQSRLKIRLPQERISLLLRLVGQRIEMDGHAIRLGNPQIKLLTPSPQLYARIVTIKGFTEPEPFQEAVNRKLQEMAIDGMPSVGPRRVVRVGDHKIVGFALAIHQLNDDASLLLQESGMGGRRRMGCGIFFPIAIDRVIGQPPQRVEKVSR